MAGLLDVSPIQAGLNTAGFLRNGMASRQAEAVAANHGIEALGLDRFTLRRRTGRVCCLASLLSTSLRSGAASSPWRLHWSRAPFIRSKIRCSARQYRDFLQNPRLGNIGIWPGNPLRPNAPMNDRELLWSDSSQCVRYMQRILQQDQMSADERRGFYALQFQENRGALSQYLSRGVRRPSQSRSHGHRIMIGFLDSTSSVRNE